LQPVAGVLGRGPVGLGDAAHQGGEIDLAEAALLRAGLDLRDAQQGREDLEQAVGFAECRLGRRLVLGGGRGVLTRILELLAQPVASRSVSPPAQMKARTMACCMSIRRLASCATRMKVPSGRVTPKPVSLARASAGSSAS